MKQIWFKIALIITIQSLVFQAFAQTSPENLKTVLVYRIADCVKWKADSSTVFTIGVLSDNQLLLEKFNELSKVAKINNKPIRIKQINSLNSIHVLHILYVDKSYNEAIYEILKQAGKNSLIITEENNKLGNFMINLKFDAQKGSYTFVYNRANILFAGLDLKDEIVLLKGTEIEIRQLYLEAKKLSDEQLNLVNELKSQSDVQTKNIIIKNDSIQKMKGLIDLNQSKITKQVLVLAQKDSLSSNLNKRIENQQIELNTNLLQTKQLLTERNTAEDIIHSYQAKINQQANLSNNLTNQISAKQKELVTLNNSLNEKEVLIKRQNSWLIVSILIILIVIISVIIISRAYVVTQRARKKVAEQKKELEITLKQLKSTQLQLVQSEKMASLGVFISGIAHEINNPVNFISMGVDAIEKVIEKVIALFAELNKLTPESKGDEIQQLIELKQKLKFQRSLDAVPEILANIKIGITRTIAITNGLRLYARMDSEEKIYSDINQIIETAIMLIKPQLNSEIAIQANYGELQQTKVYPGKLSQVFVNILGNAIDAIHSMGKSAKKHAISITTNEIEGIIHIEFSDTGNGIPPELISKIFDPFYTTKEVGKGTGLGMSIATSIIEEHDGKISANNNPDGGATFKIEIPIHND
jgi:signal transduction histidine kinase